MRRRPFLTLFNAVVLVPLLACGGRAVREDVATTAAFGARAPAAREAPFVWGVNGHPARWSEAYDWSDGDGRLERQLALIRELGFTHYRVDVGFEMDGRETGRLAAVAEAAGRYGVTLLPVMTFSTVGVPSSAREAYLAGRRMGTTFVRHHGSRFPVVEVGNELDIPAMIGGHPNGHDADHYLPPLTERYAELLRGILEAMAAGAPGMQTMVNFAQSHTGWIRLLADRGVPFDLIGWHMYVNEAGYGDDREHGSDYRSSLARLLGLGRDIWITEVNRHEGSGPRNAFGREQALVLDRLAGEMYAHPRVRAFIIYELFDETAALANSDSLGRPVTGDDDEAWYGLVHCLGGPGIARRCGGELERKPAFLDVRDRRRALAVARKHPTSALRPMPGSPVLLR
jgi:hypothetical protein